MKFLFTSLLRGNSWGGCEELWSKTALELADRGHQVVASIDGKETLPARLDLLKRKKIKVQLRHLPRPSLAWRLKAKFLRKDPDIYQLERYGQLINDTQPDLICISNARVVDDPRYLEVASCAAVPTVNISQANANEWWPYDDLARRCALALRGVRASYFVSEANLRLWELQTAEKHPNSKVIRNPFNVPFDTKLGWPDTHDGFRLACVARLDPRSKSQDLIFQLLAKPEWKERDIRISLFGTGPSQETLRRLVSSMDLEERVLFEGHVNNIEGIWANHHALILPSRYEGLPLALVEAMLCRRMAVVTDVAGNTEVIDDGITGFVAPHPTVEALSSTLERAWERRSVWRQMGEEAGIRIRSKVPVDPAAELADQLERIARAKA